MSKMKRAMFYKGKFLLDDRTVYEVVDVKPYARYKGARETLHFFLKCMRTGDEFIHRFDDKRRKEEYVVVAARDGHTPQGKVGTE